MTASAYSQPHFAVLYFVSVPGLLSTRCIASVLTHADHASVPADNGNQECALDQVTRPMNRSANNGVCPRLSISTTFSCGERSMRTPISRGLNNSTAEVMR